MTIHLVETYEEDACIAVARHIAALLDEGQVKTALADTTGSVFLQKCISAANDGRWDELIKQLSAHLDLVFSKCSDKDAECIVSVIVLMVSRLEKDSNLAETASKLATSIGKQPDVAGEVKLNALLGLYTSCPTKPTQYLVLLQLLKFAQQSKQLAALLVPVIKGKADDWRRSWSLKPSMAYELYIHLANVMKVVSDRGCIKEYLRLQSSALTLAQDPAELAKAKPFAVEAVKTFIRSPDIFQCDFWELPAVQQLAQDKASASLLQLLDVMLQGDLQGFKKVGNAGLLDTVGVSADAAMTKMRLMALLMLGSKASGAPVAFTDIQAALDITPEQVQPWVVRAIGSKLLDGRIDQVAATVTISRCHHRTFTSKEWQGLGQQLSSLRGALVSASDLLGAKQAARGAGAAGRPAATQAVH